MLQLFTLTRGQCHRQTVFVMQFLLMICNVFFGFFFFFAPPLFMVNVAVAQFQRKEKRFMVI